MLQHPTNGLTSQAAVNAVGNRYDLVLIASARVREFVRGHVPKIKVKHGHVITALLEIEHGHVGRDYLYKNTNEDRRVHKRNQNKYP